MFDIVIHELCTKFHLMLKLQASPLTLALSIPPTPAGPTGPSWGEAFHPQMYTVVVCVCSKSPQYPFSLGSKQPKAWHMHESVDAPPKALPPSLLVRDRSTVHA